MEKEKDDVIQALQQILESDEIKNNPFGSLPAKNKMEALKYLYEQSEEIKPAPKGS